MSVNAVPLQFIDMDFCDPGDERKMVVGASALVAPVLPTTGIAMLLGIRIDLGRFVLSDGRFETSLDTTVVG
jgi:hypothetical protein